MFHCSESTWDGPTVYRIGYVFGYVFRMLRQSAGSDEQLRMKLRTQGDMVKESKLARGGREA